MKNLPPTVVSSKSFLYEMTLAALSGLCLVLAFPAFDWSLLAWIGFVPLLISVKNVPLSRAWLLSSMTGTLWILGGYCWLNYVAEHFMQLFFPLNWLFALGYSLFWSQLPAIFVTGTLWIQRKTSWPEMFVFPILATGCWSVFPNIFFFNLGNGTTPLLTALQGIEWTGTYGLDFMMMLVNVTVWKLWESRGKAWKQPTFIAALVLISIWFGYGSWRLSNWQTLISQWHETIIGIVQPDNEASFQTLPPEPGYSKVYPPEMEMSLKLAGQGATMIVWPEGNSFYFTQDLEVRKAFLKQTREMGVHLVFHDKMVEWHGRQPLFRNSTFWLMPSGLLGGIYHKRKLVPFGEYIPWLEDGTAIMEWFGIGGVLTPGTETAVFDISGMRVVPLICYEIQFQEFVGDAIGEDSKGKILVVQSNDGWYGQGAQSAQHRTSNVLRAVENRVPVVHVINNGASSVVMPDGETIFLSPEGQRGSWAVKVPYSSEHGGTFFSRHPHWFIWWMRGMAIVMMLMAIFKSRSKRG
ncbi:MAG: apolipoprotein N-acyltransferase [SAR324 cluster bacterium]|nr:apolipoprotein N-acyltransferase [SAR324 cluster bacterium]